MFYIFGGFLAANETHTYIQIKVMFNNIHTQLNVFCVISKWAKKAIKLLTGLLNCK